LMSFKLNSLADIQQPWAPCTCTVGNEQYLPHHSLGDIRSTCLSPQHSYADKLHGTLAIHPLTTSSHHQSWQSQWKCAPSPSHVFSGWLSSYLSRNSWKTCQTHTWFKPMDWCGMPTCQWYSQGWLESHPHEMFNIQWFIPFKNLTKTTEDAICHTRCLTILSSFWVIMIDTSGVSPR
jgi:hypothetical protein